MLSLRNCLSVISLCIFVFAVFMSEFLPILFSCDERFGHSFVGVDSVPRYMLGGGRKAVEAFHCV